MYELNSPWQLILGSSSPRRQWILRTAGLPFTVIPASMEEKINPARPLGPEAQRQALLKALSFSNLKPGQILLTADTLVGFEGRLLGKPRDRREAQEMLSQLSGNTHHVATGFCLAGREKEQEEGFLESGFQVTAVTFRRLSAGEIAAYVDRGESMDKAGAYGLQEAGAALVESVQGNFYNVLGLPLAKIVEKMLIYNLISPCVSVYA
jgi:septum formation protein